MSPNELVMSVRPWCRTLAARYAAMRRRYDLTDDLEASLVSKLLELAHRPEMGSSYDPGRGSRSHWAAQVASTHLPREFDRLAWPVRLPAHADAQNGTDKGTGSVQKGFAVATAGFAVPVDLVDPAEDRATPTGELEDRDERRFVLDVLRWLPERERAAVEAYYGLDGGPGQLSSAASRLGTSREGARQIRNRGLERIREHVGI